jgi:glycosyltransferase involved in cell wall biosynthesis
LKKVIHLFPVYKLGGAPVCILRFIKSTGNIYNHSCVAKLEDQDLFSDFQNVTNGNCYNLDLTSFSLLNLFKLIRLFLNLKPDIVHVHGKGGALYGFLIGLLLYKKFKIFYTYHGFYKKWNGFKWKFYLVFEKLFSLIYEKSIAVSDSEYLYILESLKLRANKVIIIQNGVYVAPSILPNEIKSQLGLHSFNIVTFSRFSHQKDLETMIMSFNRIRKSKSVGLHIFGGYLKNDETYYRRITSIIEDLNLEGSVYLWGEYSNVSSFISYFNIYWTTAKFEGLPTAVIESFLSKTLVVGTSCRGNVDLIFDGKTGYLTEISDVNSNVNAIIKALNSLNTDCTLQIINEAYNVGLRYSIEYYIENMNKLYLSKL